MTGNKLNADFLIYLIQLLMLVQIGREIKSSMLNPCFSEAWSCCIFVAVDGNKLPSCFILPRTQVVWCHNGRSSIVLASWFNRESSEDCISIRIKWQQQWGYSCCSQILHDWQLYDHSLPEWTAQIIFLPSQKKKAMGVLMGVKSTLKGLWQYLMIASCMCFLFLFIKGHDLNSY